MTVRFGKAAGLRVPVGAYAVAVSARRGQPRAACDKACLQRAAGTYLAAHDLRRISIVDVERGRYSKNGRSRVHQALKRIQSVFEER